MHYSTTKDTIVALATPAGNGAIAIIRLSGQDAIEICEKVFSGGKKLTEQPSHTVHFGVIKEDATIIDEVLVSIFISPRSYTGENIIEISCHGSIYVQQRIINVLLRSGARLAQPGEFTLRAFLNRKLDLSQAEAVADLIASSSESSHRLAMQQMRGGFSSEIKNLRQQLIHFASLIELELDFAEEDVEFANRGELKQLILVLKSKIVSLINSFETGNVLKHGIPVVIAGKPNAGKSTLLNALLNEERAIVSPVAGTTRDTVEEEITLDGIRFRFIDTAGLRETTDIVERIGVNKTFEKLSLSRIIIYLFDINELNPVSLKSALKEIENKLQNSRAFIIPVANKIDQSENNREDEYGNFENIIFISAKIKTHLHQLRNKLVLPFKNGNLIPDETIVSNARHLESLEKTNAALVNVLEGIEKKVTNDFVATDIRYALNHLGEITGEITTNDLLENIFSKFCIGK